MIACSFSGFDFEQSLEVPDVNGLADYLLGSVNFPSPSRSCPRTRKEVLEALYRRIVRIGCSKNQLTDDWFGRQVNYSDGIFVFVARLVYSCPITFPR